MSSSSFGSGDRHAPQLHHIEKPDGSSQSRVSGGRRKGIRLTLSFVAVSALVLTWLFAGATVSGQSSHTRKVRASGYQPYAFSLVPLVRLQPGETLTVTDVVVATSLGNTVVLCLGLSLPCYVPGAGPYTGALAITLPPGSTYSVSPTTPLHFQAVAGADNTLIASTFGPAVVTITGEITSGTATGPQ